MDVYQFVLFLKKKLTESTAKWQSSLLEGTIPADSYQKSTGIYIAQNSLLNELDSLHASYIKEVTADVSPTDEVING
jgi:hypothetical protein